MGSKPPQEHVLVGPFFTRRQAVQHSGLSPAELLHHPGVLRLGGPACYQEVYAGFQFDADGLREDLAAVVEVFGPRRDPWSVCDWITRPNPQLGGRAPLALLDEDGRLPRVIAAVHA